jgi:hypothetical protein
MTRSVLCRWPLSENPVLAMEETVFKNIRNFTEKLGKAGTAAPALF